MTDEPNRGSTINVHHPWFDDWKLYLGVELRCLRAVYAVHRTELTKLADCPSCNAWFAMDETEPSFFAGLWTDWHGTRRKDEGPMDCKALRVLHDQAQ
ncbi:MAG: hypothetical protein WBA73_16435 [Devosia sp.]